MIKPKSNVRSRVYCGLWFKCDKVHRNRGKCDVAAGERTGWSLSHSYTGSRRSQQELGSGYYNFSKSSPQWTWPFNKAPFFLKVPQSPPAEPPVFKYLSIWGGASFIQIYHKVIMKALDTNAQWHFLSDKCVGLRGGGWALNYRERGPRSVLKTILGLDLDPSRWLVPI